MNENRDSHSISLMCRVYGVTRDGYNSWQRRGISQRQQDDELLFEQIYEIFCKSGRLYGSPKVFEKMKAKGIRIGEKRVARIMRENGLKARVATLYRSKKSHLEFIARIPNRILDVVADRPNKIWVGDVTYLQVDGEWRYLAVVIDKFSRKVVGWSLSKNRDAKLTLAAINQAFKNRGVHPGLIFHSDRGIEYRADAYTKRLAMRGVTQSMNRPASMNDNAHMESFFHNFKAERYHGRQFRREDMLRGMITQYMGFYNKIRIHSSVAYLSPEEYECRAA
ncbi:MAG: IS3 family transposase [Candidatus Sedimenticola sp. (ex Thyasira tokunagai)]